MHRMHFRAQVEGGNPAACPHQLVPTLCLPPACVLPPHPTLWLPHFADSTDRLPVLSARAAKRTGFKKNKQSKTEKRKKKKEKKKRRVALCPSFSQGMATRGAEGAQWWWGRGGVGGKGLGAGGNLPRPAP